MQEPPVSAVPASEEVVLTVQIRYDKEGLALFQVGEIYEINGYYFQVWKLDSLSKPQRVQLVGVGPVEKGVESENG